MSKYRGKEENGIVPISHISADQADSPYFSQAESVDGLYRWHSGNPGYIGISCEMTGLPDNTDGHGRQSIYLQYPGNCPVNFVNGAREFYDKVQELRRNRVSYVRGRFTQEAVALRKAKFNEAKVTGKPVELQRWIEVCDDPDEECDMDRVIAYAMPDGSIKLKRRHTW